MAESSITVAAPGLDDRFRLPTNDIGDERAANGTNVPHLLTVANVLPGKGLGVLLDALERIADHAWTWRLIGGTELDPDYGACFRDQLDSASYRDRVSWDGTVKAAQMPAAYDAADLFVLPTHFETCSMATREAMARGCAVVASDVGGLPDNFGDRDAGVLVPPNDPSALAQALGNLLTDSARRTSLAREALVKSQSFPSWETTAACCADALRCLRIPAPNRTDRASRPANGDIGAGREP
jgi:glycosyltransferase involved in cell wall biosynthesis